jgi:hypothetical protein
MKDTDAADDAAIWRNRRTMNFSASAKRAQLMYQILQHIPYHMQTTQEIEERDRRNARLIRCCSMLMNITCIKPS